MIIRVGGNQSYAHYSILIGVSSLLPFLDFGIGYKVNSIILDHHAMGNVDVKNELSRCATILVCISTGSILISFFLYGVGVFEKLTIFGFETSDSFLIEIILVLTFINVPLSLGSRILFAEGKVLRPQLIGLGGTLLTLSTLPLLRIMQLNQIKWLSVIPILTMVVVNSILFLHVQAKSNFRITLSLKFIDSNLKNIFNYGLKATIVTSFFPVILQIPKYVLGFSNSISEIAAYSIWLLFVQPIISVSAFHTFSVLPRIRKTSNRLKQKKDILENYFYGSLVGIGLAVVLNALVLINPFSKITLPSSSLSFYLIVLIPLYVFRQNVIATFTNIGNLKLLIGTYAISLIISLGIYISLDNFTASNSILTFLITESLISFFITILIFRRHLNFLWAVKSN